MSNNLQQNQMENVLEDIIITHFINPSMFWYKVSCELPKELVGLEEKLCKLFFTNRNEGYKPMKNEIVAVFIVSESRYCRARVEEILEYRQAPDKYMLWAIDFGKVYSTHAKFIRHLPKELISIQIDNIYFGGLNNIIPAKQTFDFRRYTNIMEICEKWSAESCQLFDNVIKDAYTLEFVVQKKINDQFFGILKASIQTTDKISINDVLIKSNGAIETDNFVSILKDLKLNQRSFWLTNENDTSKFNENTFNSFMKLNKNELNVLPGHRNEIKNDQNVKNTNAVNGEKVDDDEAALYKKINEWNLGNSKIANENLEKIQKLKYASNNDNHSLDSDTLKSHSDKILNEDFSKKVLDKQFQGFRKIGADIKSDLILFNDSDHEPPCKDPFDINNLPLQVNVTDCDNFCKKSNSELSSDSKTRRQTAREKILARVKNNAQTLTNDFTKPKIVIPAGFDLRNLPQKKVEQNSKLLLKNEMKFKISQNDISQPVKATLLYSEKIQLNDKDSNKSCSTMSESVNTFLKQHDNKASNNVKSSDLVENDASQLASTRFDTNIVRNNFKGRTRIDENKTNSKRIQENKSTHCVKTYEQLDEICIPTSTIGKDSVMVHGTIPIPLNRLAEAQFTPYVHNQMEILGHRAIYRVQQYCWPHLLRFNSLILINGEKSGKTFAFLPAICSLIEMENENGNISDADKGPMAIIVLSTRSEAEKISKLCKHFTKKVVLCTDQQNCAEALNLLFNTTDVLICTPKGLKILGEKNKRYRWFSKERIRHFIIENIDTWCNEKCSFLSESMDNLQIKKLDNIQIVVTSKIWLPLLKSFLKLKSFNNPLICFGAYIEAAVFANTKFCLKIVKSDIKVNFVMEFLQKNYYEHQKTIVLCNSDDDVQFLSDKIRAVSFSVSVCTSQSSLDDINMIKCDWNNSSSIKRSVLVCSDDILPDLDIKDAQNLIHYSLSSSWTQTCYRFSVLLRYHENKLIINDKVKIFDESKKEPAKTLILLDESNNEQLPKLIKFLDRNKIIIEETIMKLTRKIEIERENEQNLEERPICSKFLEFGELHNTSQCRSRHVLTNKDKPMEDIPTDGEIKFHLISVKTPTIFNVRILEHKAKNSTIWHFVKQSNGYASFFMKFNMYFSNFQNHETYFPIIKQEICVVADNGEFYRCQILEINKIEVRGGTEQNIIVKLVDYGTVMTFKSSQLLVLPKKFGEFPFQAVELRILGIVPYDKEEVWDRKTMQTVRHWFEKYAGDKKMINTSVIEFALNNTIFVKEVVMKSELTALKTFVDKIFVKKNLIQKKMVIKDDKIENYIKSMALEMGLFLQPKVSERSSLSSSNDQSLDNYNKSMEELNISAYESKIIPKNLTDLPKKKSDKNLINNKIVSKTKETWNNLAGNKFSKVFVTEFKSPDYFYIRRNDSNNAKKFEKLTTKIKNFINNGAKSIDEPTLGLNCLVKCDEIYMRSKIIGLKSENFQLMVTVFLLDSGSMKKTTTKQLYAVNEDILNIVPFQAILCSLVGISSKDVNGNWTDEESNYIYQHFIANNVNLYARPTLEDPPALSSYLKYSKYKIILVDFTSKTNPVQVNLDLYSRGLATKDPDSEHFMDICDIFERDVQHNFDSSENSDSSSIEWKSEPEKPSFNYCRLQEDNCEREFEINFDESEIEDFLQSFGLPMSTKIVPIEECKDKKITNAVENVNKKQIEKSTVTENNIEESLENSQLDTKPKDFEINQEKKFKNIFDIIKRKKRIMLLNQEKNRDITIKKMPQLKSRYVIPKVIWRQNEDLICLYINAPNIDDYELKLKQMSLVFSAIIEDKLNVLCLNLFGSIDSVSHKICGLSVVIKLIKTIKGCRFLWPRLTKETDKHFWLKYDYESLINQTDSTENLAILKTFDNQFERSDDSSDSSFEQNYGFDRITDDLFENIDEI